MMSSEYKNAILYDIEKACDNHGVELIISRSVERFPESDLFKYLVIIYLHILQSDLRRLSEQDIDSLRKRNIRHALYYLRQMNENREKVKQ